VVSEEFVKEHMSNVEAIASSIIGGGKAPPGTDFGDLVSWGIEGLIKAKNNFKENKGTQFKTYAYYRIRGEMLDKIRSEWHQRNPMAYENYRKRLREKITQVAEEKLRESEGKGMSPENQVSKLVETAGVAYMLSVETSEIVSKAEGTRNPEIEIIDENQAELWDEVKNLKDDEQQIVEMFYVEGIKQVEIAKRMNYSRSKICRIHMQILTKLKSRLSKRMSE
jgi:RNA polymerase sigma factor FliA